MKSVKSILKKLGKDKVKISHHVKRKIADHLGIEIEKVEKVVKNKLFDFGNLLIEEKLKNNKYFLIYHLSHRFHMIIVVVIPRHQKFVAVATAFKSSKKIEKLIKTSGVEFVYIRKIPPE